MENVIYSASPLQAFMGALVTIALILAISLGGLASAFFQRRQKLISRIGIGLLGGFLLLVAMLMGFVTLRTYRTGSLTTAARLDDKFIAHDNCGKGRICDRYVLEMSGGGKVYDLNVAPGAYEEAQTRVCYQFTYYPEKGLLEPAEYSQDAYEPVGNITRLEAVSDQYCQ